MKKLKAALVVIIIAIIAVIGIGVYFLFFNNNSKSNQVNNHETETETETEAPVEITLVAVGDDLIHDSIYNQARVDGGYNFDFMFENVKSYVSAADIAVINQETIMGGADRGYSGYPLFNTPDEVGDAIVNAGFDVVLHASNHAKDQGTEGIAHATSFWKTKYPQITMLGLNESQAERDTIKIVDVKGVKIAMLNYTYSLNGLVLPEGQEYLVNVMDDSTRAQVITDIQNASTQADFVIVFPHWGTEYMNTPSDDQRNWAIQMTDAGADLIIGAHPHVVQPVEWVQTPSGNWSLCYYSLGNYISSQAWLDSYGSETVFNTELGGMASVTLIKENGMTYIKQEATGVYPLVTQTAQGAKTTSYLLRDYNETLASAHLCRSRFGSSFSTQWFIDKSNEVFGSFYIQ